MMKINAKSKSALGLLLGGERRQMVMIPLFAILVSLVAISVIVLWIGKNPLDIFRSLLQGAGILPRPNYSAHQSVFTAFLDTLDAYTPLLFAALAVAVAFQSSLFNIGVSGQMLLAGFLATALVGYSGLPAIIARPLVILVGISVGALVGALIGWLKHRFNINEVVSSIMLNYIFQYAIAYFITTGYIDPVTRQSRNIVAAARLTLKDVLLGGNKFSIPLCFLLALLCAIGLHLYLSRTRQGYDLKAVGLAPKAAGYAGIRIGRTLISTMMISGALAGLAGVTYYLGYYASIRPNALAKLGFDSIAVALVGNAHPIGIVFSSFLITVLSKGSTYMSSSVGVQQEISSLVTGMILLFTACGSYIREKLSTTVPRAGK
ncbi:MAG: ABC transporter permease [Candidatus Limiplasma sp.]|nr:ABC transporter permease [Candidatus Limiplasma sp.]